MSDEKHRIEVDLSGSLPEHVMPSGMMVVTNDAGEHCMECVIHLSVETPERVADHIVEVLEAFAGNFSQTEFSGKVTFQMWNDAIPDDACGVVNQVIAGTLAKLQDFATSNGFASADGNPLIFSYAFSNKFPPEFED